MIASPFTRKAVATLFALVIISIAKPATPQGVATPPSPNAILLAKQLVQIKGVKTVFTPIVRGVIEKAKDVFLQSNFMWQKDLDEVAADMNKEYDSRANELVDASARIYARHFTEAELKNMLTFYQSPLGQKMLIEEPKVLDESMINAGKWADGFSDEIIAKMRDEMRKRGHDL